MTNSEILRDRKIYLATDHAGFELKEQVKSWFLQEHNIEVIDVGAEVYDGQDDFTDFISRAAEAVSANPTENCAIIFGGSGQGEAMMANRFKNVRATVYYGGDESIITLSREHNDANVLSIGARFVTFDLAKNVIWDWLNVPSSSEEKYRRRNSKMDL